MPAFTIKRSSQEYDKLLEDIPKKITKENAKSILEETKINFFIKLNLLNIDNITEVEDFYLLSFKLLTCISIIAADEKSHEDNISLEDAIYLIDTDTVLDYLQKEFQNSTDQNLLFKINEIEKNFKPWQGSWAAIHVRMYSLYELMKNTNHSLSETVKYLELLSDFENKIVGIGEHNCEAKKVALTLHKDLKNLVNKSLNDTKVFVEQVKTIIAAAIPTLQQDLGWGDYLTNLAKEICNTATKAAASLGFPGRLFAIKKSDAVKEAEKLQDEVLSTQSFLEIK